MPKYLLRLYAHLLVRILVLTKPLLKEFEDGCGTAYRQAVGEMQSWTPSPSSMRTGRTILSEMALSRIFERVPIKIRSTSPFFPIFLSETCLPRIA
jgi:hypothetical protein